MTTLEELLCDIRACTICKEHLPFPPKPVLRASTQAKILIVGQAPGLRVQISGVPWDDASGERLRSWLDISKEDFYDEQKICIIPMGFCYPGTGKSGDFPPRKECARTWQAPLRAALPQIETTLLIGAYAVGHYLGDKQKATLTETINHYEDYLPAYFPMPHPSPRNNIWLKKNLWFERDIVPILRARFQESLG